MIRLENIVVKRNKEILVFYNIFFKIKNKFLKPIKIVFMYSELNLIFLTFMNLMLTFFQFIR